MADLTWGTITRKASRKGVSRVFITPSGTGALVEVEYYDGETDEILFASQTVAIQQVVRRMTPRGVFGEGVKVYWDGAPARRENGWLRVSLLYRPDIGPRGERWQD